MCAPPVLVLAATALSAVGSGIGALQAAASGRYQAKVADMNAALDTEAAKTAGEQGQKEAARLYRKIGQVQGQQIAAQAANGIDTSFGSAVQMQQDTTAMGAEDVASLYEGTYQKVRGFEINAANSRAQAQGARQAAKGALIKGAFDMGSSILGGVGQYNKLKRGFG